MVEGSVRERGGGIDCSHEKAGRVEGKKNNDHEEKELKGMRGGKDGKSPSHTMKGGKDNHMELWLGEERNLFPGSFKRSEGTR